ncbi:hypothetical protein C1H46_031662 [Malus baccata]|uniref:Uncharacterized protein n=1 Tax=Malus baccata TaxID=106549 RepID=A0A540L8I6_MALBA|nr:hypothetical protein C1H46_031662 [Malus baccata]
MQRPTHSTLFEAHNFFAQIAQKFLLSNILDPSLTLLASTPQRTKRTVKCSNNGTELRLCLRCYSNNCKYKFRGRSYSFCGATGVCYRMRCFSLYGHMKLQMQIFLKVHDDPSNAPV